MSDKPAGCVRIEDDLLATAIGEAAPGAGQRVERHIATCASCRREFENYRAVDSAVSALREAPFATGHAAEARARLEQALSLLAEETPWQSTPYHQRQIFDVGHLDHLSGLEGFGAARLPALTLGEDVAFALGPVEDFGGQAAHGLCAEPYGASLGTSKRAEDNQDQADEDRRGDADHRP